MNQTVVRKNRYTLGILTAVNRKGWTQANSAWALPWATLWPWSAHLISLGLNFSCGQQGKIRLGDL